LSNDRLLAPATPFYIVMIFINGLIWSIVPLEIEESPAGMIGHALNNT